MILEVNDPRYIILEYTTVICTIQVTQVYCIRPGTSGPGLPGGYDLGSKRTKTIHHTIEDPKVTTLDLKLHDITTTGH